MISATGQRHSNSNKERRRAGFTLVELIVVMTMMVIVLGLVSPSLKAFFRGRDLDNEARRFLALTRYGQSRAISEGVPIDLWINARLGTYGLRAQAGYTETQAGEKNFTAEATVQVSASPPPSITTLTRSNYWTQATANLAASLPTLHFQPDGFIGETSPRIVYFRQGANEQIRVVENPTHLRYEIQTGNTPASPR